jgi:hypothetical protein
LAPCQECVNNVDESQDDGRGIQTRTTWIYTHSAHKTPSKVQW